MEREQKEKSTSGKTAARKEERQSEEHILACLSPAPSNGEIICTAARLAKTFHGKFTALYIETPDFDKESPENKQRLMDNQRLAASLGARIERIYGEDVPYQIAEYARLSGVTRIVLRRSAIMKRHFRGRPTLTERLISYLPEIDIHVIPDRSSDATYLPPKELRQNKWEILRNIAKTAGILVLTTVLGFLFEKLNFTDANIIMVYLLGVVLTAMVTSRKIYSLLASAASVVLFDVFFTAPRGTVIVGEKGYPATFVIMFLTAYIAGTLAVSCKEQASISAKNARRSKILFDTNQLLSKVKGRENIVGAMAQQLGKLLERNIVVYLCEDGKLSPPRLFPVNPAESQNYDADSEISAARRAMEHRHGAGATTDILPQVRYLYTALRIGEDIYGVVGIETAERPLDAAEHGILLSILGEGALALENEKNAREKEAAAILAESEQLRANLLRTISHDLRTPLTTISGNASSLMSNSGSFDEETKQKLYSDIYDDSMWLFNLVENLLYATRIEEGRMMLRTSTELLDDIVEEAVLHVRRSSGTHRITSGAQDGFLLVKADAKLVMQVIVNIVDNACKYTPEGSQISVTTCRQDGMACVRIADTGAGIPPEEKKHIFDKFYCGSSRIADNRRSLGLGLYLCKAIVEAHGGTIGVTDNVSHGSVFQFTLPLEEVTLHE